MYKLSILPYREWKITSMVAASGNIYYKIVSRISFLGIKSTWNKCTQRYHNSMDAAQKELGKIMYGSA